MILFSALDFKRMSKKRVIDITNKFLENDGGEGSGNFNHEGRPGMVGGSSANGGGGGHVSCSPQAKKTMNGLMRKIKGLKKEQSFIIGQNGEILASAKGDKNSVGMKLGVKREHQTGNIALHNHPTGGTFSPDDLTDFGLGATEIHVCGPDGHYALINTKWDTKERYDGWIPMREALEKATDGGYDYGSLKKKAENSEEVKKLDGELSAIANEWMEKRKAGASTEELNEFYRKSDYDALAEKRKKALRDEIRRLETEPFDRFYREHAKEYGFEYIHDSGKKGA